MDKVYNQDSQDSSHENWVPSGNGKQNYKSNQSGQERQLRDRGQKNYKEQDVLQGIEKYLKKNYRESSDTLIDTDFEESLRYFEYSLDKVKAYWILPLSYLLERESNFVLESLAFPYSWKKRWRFLADVQKDDCGLSKVFIGIEAVQTELELNSSDWKRDLRLSFRVTEKLGSFNVEKTFNKIFDQQNLDSGINLPQSQLPQINLLSKDRLIIEVTLKENKTTKQVGNSAITHLGLINSGNLCYMNSFLQTLYHLTAFSRQVWSAPIESEKDGKKPIIQSLQKLFYNLKCGKRAISTQELIKSFGWDKKQASVQQDVQEFCLIFMEAIEKRFSTLPKFDQFMNKTFKGEILNYIQCLEVDSKSESKEQFIELQLTVRNNLNIYDCLDQYTNEELLDGENKYQTEQFGKQSARKGIKILSLPPVLMIQMKRFEYDYQKEANIKITDYCEYQDEINLQKYVARNSEVDETTYKLFSVLVHQGSGASSGHYYAFIRPDMKQWYKFNDDVVTHAEPEEVFDDNFGGYYTEARLNKLKEIETWEESRMSSAYMLVYVRNDLASKLLRPLESNDIPQQLITEIEANKKAEEERKRKNDEFVKIYLTSSELLKDISTPGIIFYKEGNNDKEYEQRFFKQNKQRRLKIYVKKSFKIADLMEFISKQTGIPEEQIMIWKIRTSKEQVTPVTIRKFISTGGVNVQILANGPQSNQTKSVFFIHTVNKKKYSHIFKPTELYYSEFFGIKTKNLVKFKSYDSSIKNEFNEQRDIVDKITEPLVIQKACQQMLDLMDEKCILIFLKAYSCVDGKPQLRYFNYCFMKKNGLLGDLINEIQGKFGSALDFDNAKYYREDKSKYILTELEKDNVLDAESDDCGLCIVLSFPQDRYDYIDPIQYYQDLSQRTWVSLISGTTKDKNEPQKILLNQQLFYYDLLQFISEKLLDGLVPPNKIITKCKYKGSYQFIPIPYLEMEQVRIQDMIKYDERIYFEVSKIAIEELQSKERCSVFYYSSITNRSTPEEELFMEKSATIKDLINEIHQKDLFGIERLEDFQEWNQEDLTLKIIVLEKKGQIVGRAFQDTEISQYNKKYQLRAELVPTKYDRKDKSQENFYPIYGAHTTKDGHNFSHSFAIFAKVSKSSNNKPIKRKNITGGELRARLMSQMKKWDIDCCGKEIKITDEYFNKLRIYLKQDPQDTHNCKVENDELEPLNEINERGKKFYLEIVHPLNLPMGQQQQMKISI